MVERSRCYASRMHGTFNGVCLRRIISVATELVDDRTLTTFRVLEFSRPDLEAQLCVDAPALMILADKDHRRSHRAVRLEPAELV
jgi:hypothetical protein